MKRFLITVKIVIALVLLIFAGELLNKHFVTEQISDRGGMINPDYIINVDNAPIAEPEEKEETQS